MHFEYFLLGLTIFIVWKLSVAVERSLISNSAAGQNPVTWFIPTWMAGLFLMSLPIFVFPDQLNSFDFVYIAAIHIFFAGGSLAAILFCVSPKTVAQHSKRNDFSEKAIVMFLVVGIVGVLMYGYDALASGRLSISERLSVENAWIIKQQYADVDQKAFVGKTIKTASLYMYGFWTSRTNSLCLVAT